jgi:3-deoxy-7-phosphoheptulonate synthase
LQVVLMSGPKRKRAGGWGASKVTAGGGRPRGGWSAPQPTQDINVVETVSLVPPRVLVKDELPMTPAINRTVVESRETVRRIMSGLDGRMLVVVGPCSIHDEQAAAEYAGRLAGLASELQDRLSVIMRVYFEKPRTTVGWKGLINDPHLDDSFEMETGLRIARRLLLSILGMGLPAGTEMLDPITPQYIADLITWSAIGARTIESQTHRQMASGLSMPIGYKNGTDGNLQMAIDAMKSARHSHSFLGIDTEGRTAIIRTRGNAWGHLILRGGRSGPNYSPESIAAATSALKKAGLPPYIMVDCSHANSGKSFANQEKVLKSAVEQRVQGNPSIIGLLIESNLFEGSQPFQQDKSKLRYGVSITDECIGWEKTEALLRYTFDLLGRGRV